MCHGLIVMTLALSTLGKAIYWNLDTYLVLHPETDWVTGLVLQPYAHVWHGPGLPSHWYLPYPGLSLCQCNTLECEIFHARYSTAHWYMPYLYLRGKESTSGRHIRANSNHPWMAFPTARTHGPTILREQNSSSDEVNSTERLPHFAHTYHASHLEQAFVFGNMYWRGHCGLCKIAIGEDVCFQNILSCVQTHGSAV